MTNWIPIKDETLPTAKVRVGKRELGEETDVLGIRKGGTTAYFDAEVVDDTRVGSENLNRDVRIHPNVQQIFGELSANANLTLLTSSGRKDIPECETAYLEIHQGSRKDVQKCLRQIEYLLHRGVREVIPSERTPDGYGSFEFTVRDTAPQKTTARVTVNTGFEDPPTETDSTGGGQGTPGDDDDYDVEELIEVGTPERSFQEDAIGLDNVRPVVTQLGRIYQPEIRKEFEAKVGELDTGSSLLLFGPPGCGKTLAAECVAYELKHRCMRCGGLKCSQHNMTIEDFHGPVEFMEVNSAGISDKYVGEAPSKLEAVFEHAYDIAGDSNFLVLFFDEAESVIAERADAERQSIVELTNTFLREVDDNELSDKNILLIGATNYPQEIDTAAMNRFTQTEFVSPPEHPSELADLWKLETDAQSNTDQLRYPELGEASVGYVPREITNIRKEYVLRDYMGDADIDGRNPPPVTTEDYLEKLAETDPRVIEQYVAGLRKNAYDLEGYEDLKEFMRRWEGWDKDSGTAPPTSPTN
jgi:transitional endoplasmic reticulum ATPase